ncbi:MAG: short-chain dehydrogenase [Chloroflexota bacterium]
MDIEGKHVLVLGGFGLVGSAVCRALLAERPARLVVASLLQAEAEAAVERLRRELIPAPVEIIPLWGNIFVRAEYKDMPRSTLMADPRIRSRLLADVFQELNEDIYAASFLAQAIEGRAPGLGGHPADIIVDCINTATVLAYQNIYDAASHLLALAREERRGGVNWAFELEGMLSVIPTPQLVRHIQILYEAMKRAGIGAYIKVGTTGTGGMGLNIPYSHGERKPSRVLLTKSAMAGAHTLLLFLLARTPDAPPIVKEIKPAAAIAWKEIAYGPIRRGGQPIPLYDCPPEAAYPLEQALSGKGSFGQPTEDVLESVYIDTGENGLFSVGEFTALSTLGQMEFVTPEEIARVVVAEIKGGSTGFDVIAALDSAAMGPTYRAAFLRSAALTRLHQLEAQHGVESIAFEMLGPPRLSKLLFEAALIKRACGSIGAALDQTPESLAQALLSQVSASPDLRTQAISIGIPILLPDGRRMLRGPVMKAHTPEEGWIDLRPENMARWQARLSAIRAEIAQTLSSDTSSRLDRIFADSRAWQANDTFDIGEVVAWIFIHEDAGRRGKD